MSIRFFRCAVLYSLFGISMGIYMGAAQDFSIKGIHVHANLAGWVSMAVMGLIYRSFPAMAQSKLATVHFWLHNIGLPLMLAGIYGVWHEFARFGKISVSVGSLMVALAFVTFAINVWKNARD